MPSPFPGMDPWLEDPTLWPSLHNSLIIHLAEDLNRQLRGKYVARSGERVVVESPLSLDRHIVPDVIVTSKGRRSSHVAVAEHEPATWIDVPEVVAVEWTLEIRIPRGGRLVTAIEFLSPSNKAAEGDGKEKYRRKQQEVLASDANLVEVDLLRGGQWTVAVPEYLARERGEFDFIVSTSRAENRRGFEVHLIRLQDRLPRIAIPLQKDDRDVVADLQPLLNRGYDAGQYAMDVDYSRAPVPPLSAEQSAWARRILRARRKRRAR